MVRVQKKRLVAVDQAPNVMATRPFLAEGGIKITGARVDEEPSGKPAPDLTAARRPGYHGQTPRAVPLQDLYQSVAYLGQGLVPTECHGSSVHSLQRAGQPLFVVLVMGDLETFTADIALGTRVVLITSNFDDLVILNHHLQTTTLKAETATGLLP
jgi:hypothetical protein